MRATERAERVDRDLVEQAQRGDREAFAILARTRGDTLFGIARRIIRDAGLAEDAVQQALVIAWRELPRLRDPERFDAWLQRLLVHACYAEARHKRAWMASVRVLPIDGPAARDDVASMIDRDEVERGFRRLPPEQRAILVLHHYLGLGLNEIGEVLDIPPGTARSRLHYAHRAMRALLEADARPTAEAAGRVS
jgi:RNA polymerase sigma-70 factor (ECF subfamily)